MAIFLFFFKLAALHHLGFIIRVGYLDNPLRVLGGLCYRAKFGWNRYSSFHNMQVLIFCTLDLKIFIQVPKMGG